MPLNADDVRQLTRPAVSRSQVISPSPPPPPPAGETESAQWAIGQEEERRVGGEDGQYAEAPPTEAQMYADEVRGSIDRTNAMVLQLGENNPILRGFLIDAMDQMRSSVTRVSSGELDPKLYYGRRLMQRSFDYPSYMSDVLVNHP